MLNVSNTKFVSVFDIEDKGNFLTANLTTTKIINKVEKKDYETMRWKARFVGDCKEEAKKLDNKDKIEITNGALENKYYKEKQQAYYTVVIFDFEKHE